MHTYCLLRDVISQRHTRFLRIVSVVTRVETRVTARERANQARVRGRTKASHSQSVQRQWRTHRADPW